MHSPRAPPAARPSTSWAAQWPAARVGPPPVPCAAGRAQRRAGKGRRRGRALAAKRGAERRRGGRAGVTGGRGGRPLAKRLVVALGGNAILEAGQRGTAEEQLANVHRTCSGIADMIAQGYEVVITHGNGPQVGNILIQNEEGSRQVPAMPLDVCGAQSQGQIGYMIQRTLANELRRLGLDREVATVVTQVVVDPADPAFSNPTKPVGPFYPAPRAQELMREKGWRMREIDHRGWRRVVPSPQPLFIQERASILRLVETGVVVVASGGGGIPVCRDGSGALVGVEAVIDKDLAGERLAQDVGAHLFLILTDVDGVYLDWGRPGQRRLDRVSPSQAREYLRQGCFPPGSMGPKVEAAVRFVEAGGERAVVAALSEALLALEGRAGTQVAAA
ncbi:MAG: carbamate kinase [Acetobacteraceae bacterium]|nr:carbamate kinase [Acetobacteraceae bacterium]